ncbi:hypothetical protein GYMLUDRAFT_51208 [Collybiopsis luxurians FD-317 M1]|uniref:Dicer-like protein 1 n=1 Tax=Collybiopsis luxurians FD-317 M1 TaxID=944289 RepID=A0A0D0B8J3_9AGAR|nr:hypothetical protein GYMLUDRAFT_51208 [Collybiopsis luxurians FD-317 M1]
MTENISSVSVNGVPIKARGYQQEMLDESLQRNIIIAMDTGSGKTHIAVLRLKHESERELEKVSPTVALCEQQCNIIKDALPVSVGLISGALAPDQWKDASLWKSVLLDALRHGYILMGVDIGLIIFNEAHHAVDNDPYNRIMQEIYHKLPPRDPSLTGIASSQRRIQRPMIMGLTASPIFGGNVDKAFRMIETNLDSVIVSPRQTRSELAEYVHRPTFKHIMYNPPSISNPPFSTNLAALEYATNHLDISNDPYIKSLHNQLSQKAPGTPKYVRLDQRLSKTIANEGTFTHKGLRDFVRATKEILSEVGVWATDWFVWEVIENAASGSGSGSSAKYVMPSWQSQEKAYLLGIINGIMITPVSYYPDDITDEQSDKVSALLQCLLNKKEEAEKANESFSALVFVQRRDVVLALSELFKHHPVTKLEFQTGPLLGASDNSHRHAFLDITRRFNLIVSTSVAEEGIDVQACGCVIRWDRPMNMASWAQSRGRARKRRSMFVMMFEEGAVGVGSGMGREDVVKWQRLEAEIVARYLDTERWVGGVGMGAGGDADDWGKEEDVDMDDDDMPPLRVESMGALLTLQSAIPHLNHFCAVMPHRGHFVYQPLYDLNPPDYPIGWHSFDNRRYGPLNPYTGPWSSTVTLPRVIPPNLHVFCTERIYPMKVSAHWHAAFETYKALYKNGLVNDHLLPLFDDGEVKELKREVEKRTGMASVEGQMDPQVGEGEGKSKGEREGEMMILTQTRIPIITHVDEIKLHHPSFGTLDVRMEPAGEMDVADKRFKEAQEFTRRLLWCINGSRMRREWWETQWNTMDKVDMDKDMDSARVPADVFGEVFGYPNDIGMIYRQNASFKAYDFVQWRWDPLGEEEEAKVLERYHCVDDVQIKYPLLEVRLFHPRTNFLFPRPAGPAPPPPSVFLLPQYSSIPLISRTEMLYTFLLPSTLRAIALNLTADSLRSVLFTDQSILSTIPNSFFITALSAPVSQEPKNYQRLETLGDTVLKLVMEIQLLGEYPLWPKGYLTKRKDHAVSNTRLAKENVGRGLYRWIIRGTDILQITSVPTEGQSEPVTQVNLDTTQNAKEDVTMASPELPADDRSANEVAGMMVEPVNVPADKTTAGMIVEEGKKKKKKRQKNKKNSQELSTKDNYKCAKFFHLNIESWLPLPNRIMQILCRSDESYGSLLSTSADSDEVQFPIQLSSVEKLIGYTFCCPLLLLEALTHPSCQEDHGTISYERMEFLGDAVLDMVVTNFLYHARGKDDSPKEYAPGHIFLRKSAMVNTHILAFVCLQLKMEENAKMPKAYMPQDMEIVLEEEKHTIHLFKCLLHSSTRILEDQNLTYGRFIKCGKDITQSLEEGHMFPWAALTRLQAPKFFSNMIESILGTVYLDSEGNLDVVKEVMQSLGLYQILERMVRDDMDVLHLILNPFLATRRVTGT